MCVIVQEKNTRRQQAINSFPRISEDSTHDQDCQTDLKALKHMCQSFHQSNKQNLQTCLRASLEVWSFKAITVELVGLRPPRTEEIKTTWKHVKECPAPKIIPKLVTKTTII